MYDIIKQWEYNFHEIGKLIKTIYIYLVICMAHESHKAAKYQVFHMKMGVFFEDNTLVPIGIENLTKD